MKPVHIISYQPSQPFSAYIQVKDGFVFSGNLNTFIRIPADEVFGKKVIKPGEVLYFSKENWMGSGIFQANKIVRDGDKFTALLKGKILGWIFPVGQVGETENHLVSGSETILFPNPKTFTDLEKPFTIKIGLGAGSIKEISHAMGEDMVIVERFDADPKQPHIIKPAEGSSEAIGLSAGIPSVIYEIDSDAVEEKIDDLTEKVEELETETFGLETVSFAAGELTYKVDNLACQDLMRRFIELAARPNISELLDDLDMM